MGISPQPACHRAGLIQEKKMQKLTIGLFGFGCVGQGLYQALENSTGFKARVKKIVAKNPEKSRNAPSSLFYFDKKSILDDPEINTVVELIDDAQEAFFIVKNAMENGKNVVTANKKMLAQNLSELLEIQKKTKVALLYEAAACGSIPLIRTLEEYFDNEPLSGFTGICNGTTNYILTQSFQNNLSYDIALKQAQEKGFAESNPSNDVEGWDATFKTVLIALHSFGTIFDPSEVLRFGITQLSKRDIGFALKNQRMVKLLCRLIPFSNNKLAATVLPAFVHQNDVLARVENEFNGVVLDGAFSGEQFFKGKGAGSLPTGGAVLSDISALSFDYKYAFKKQSQPHQFLPSLDFPARIYYRFSNPDLIPFLNFETVEEEKVIAGTGYLIGKINLQNLKIHQEEIKNRGEFVAWIEN
jgi:homoserine dehydrogenase